MSIDIVSIPDGAEEDFLTLSEVATLLRVPVNTLRWWRQRGEGPRLFKISRRLVTSSGDLRWWIEQQKHGASAGLAPRGPSSPLTRWRTVEAEGHDGERRGA